MNISECVSYFKGNPNFERQLRTLLKKYKSLGKATGTIRIANATEEECKSATDILGQHFASPLHYKVEEFDAALRNSRFKCGLKELLEAYFGITIYTVREEKNLRQMRIDSFFESVAAKIHDPMCRKWLSAMRDEKKYGYSILLRDLTVNMAKTETALMNVCRGIEYLQTQTNRSLRLAIWSANVTTDPHAFDSDMLAGKLLRHFFEFVHQDNISFDAYQAHDYPDIIMDSISSSVSQIGLQLFDEDGEHPAYCAFRLRTEICTLTLANFSQIKRAVSASGKVYLVENQMVFSQLCDNADTFHSPLVCTSGQLQTAVWRLLDLLAESKCQIYYSGDFDPEGLAIASRLLERYNDSIRLWHFSTDDYRKACSDVVLPEERLKMLDSIQHMDLHDVVMEITSVGCAGYQELIISDLLQDLIKT